jgi:hypothetical protein
MKLTNAALMLVPEAALGTVLLLFMTLGGLCLVIGAKRQAIWLIATAIAIPLVTVLVEALFGELFAVMPPALVRVVAWLVLILTYLFILGALMGFLFGEHVWSDAKGHLLADAIKGILRIAVSWPMLVVWGVLAIYLWLK